MLLFAGFIHSAFRLIACWMLNSTSSGTVVLYPIELATPATQALASSLRDFWEMQDRLSDVNSRVSFIPVRVLRLICSWTSAYFVQ